MPPNACNNAILASPNKHELPRIDLMKPNSSKCHSNNKKKI